MEQILDIGSRRYAIGLEWIPLNGKDPLLAARAFSKDRKKAMGVLRSVTVDDDQTHNQVGLARTKSKGSVYSAAAHLASIYPSLIAIEKIPGQDDDLYWLCFTYNGRVVPGHDVTATDSEIKNIYNELINQYDITYFNLVMTDQVANSLEVVGEYENVSPFSLLEKTKANDKTKLKNIAGIPNAIYLGAALVIVVGGFVFYWKQAEEQRQLELEALMQQQAEEERIRLLEQKAIKKGPTQEEILAQAREEEILWLRDDFNKLGLMSAIMQVFVTADRTHSFTNGWKLEALTFTSKSPTEISTVWNRGNAQLSGLKEGSGKNDRVAFSADLNSGIVTKQISLGSRGIVDILTHIESQGTGYQDLADLLLLQNLKFTMAVVAEQDRRETIKGIENPAVASMPQLVLKKREFTITGHSLGEFIRLMGVFENVHNMIPSSVDVNREGGGFSWVVTAVLHEL